MPKPCPVCVSPSRPAIERDILSLRSPTEVARRWNLSRKTVSTHRNRDMDPLAAVDTDADTSTLARVEDLTHRLEDMLSKASTGTVYANLAGQLRQSLELLARLRRELDERPQVAILAAPEWLAVRAVVFAALAPYPDARAAVARALSGGEGRVLPDRAVALTEPHREGDAHDDASQRDGDPQQNELMTAQRRQAEADITVAMSDSGPKHTRHGIPSEREHHADDGQGDTSQTEPHPPHHPSFEPGRAAGSSQ
ncbi:MAG: helix-turn-helix transcriptional regulator [Actinomycetota bacterium]|nr:helix-turn-helix transcriptional regulator [Actinomycetota bacterium]